MKKDLRLSVLYSKPISAEDVLVLLSAECEIPDKIPRVPSSFRREVSASGQCPFASG
jgi:hypothetical protein